MNELIKIEKRDGKQLVDARDLHIFLESKQDFSNWISNRIKKYDFQEDLDFTIFLLKSPKGRPLKEYAITIDMAKELSMVENNDKGKQARRYFIEVEKRVTKQLSAFEMMRQQLDILEQQDKRLTALENKPQINAPIQQFSIMGHCNNVNKQISLSDASSYGRACSKMCRELGFVTGKVNDPRFGSVKTYPLDVLSEIIK